MKISFLGAMLALNGAANSNRVAASRLTKKSSGGFASSDENYDVNKSEPMSNDEYNKEIDKTLSSIDRLVGGIVIGSILLIGILVIYGIFT